MQLERHFVDPHGLPNRPEYKSVGHLIDLFHNIINNYFMRSHIVFAPSSSDSYSSSSFSGLTDLLEAVGDQTEAQRPTEWAQIKQHLSVIAFFIEAAGRSLSDYLWELLLALTDRMNKPFYRVLIVSI